MLECLVSQAYAKVRFLSFSSFRGNNFSKLQHLKPVANICDENELILNCSDDEDVQFIEESSNESANRYVYPRQADKKLTNTPPVHVISSNESDDDPSNNDIDLRPIAAAASSSSVVISKVITPIKTTTVAAKNPTKRQSSKRAKYKNSEKPFSYYDDYKLIYENDPRLMDETNEHDYSKLSFFKSHFGSTSKLS
jgi:hypothetical protein